MDFFQQQNKPIFPFIEGRLKQLTSYLEGNLVTQDFGSDLYSLITQFNFNLEDIYNIFRSAFIVAYNKFSMHIPQHPTRALFCAACVFDPLYIKMGIPFKDIQ